jgi:hypothetical protein
MWWPLGADAALFLAAKPMVEENDRCCRPKGGNGEAEKPGERGCLRHKAMESNRAPDGVGEVPPTRNRVQEAALRAKKYLLRWLLTPPLCGDTNTLPEGGASPHGQWSGPHAFHRSLRSFHLSSPRQHSSPSCRFYPNSNTGSGHSRWKTALSLVATLFPRHCLPKPSHQRTSLVPSRSPRSTYLSIDRKMLATLFFGGVWLPLLLSLTPGSATASIG